MVAGYCHHWIVVPSANINFAIAPVVKMAPVFFLHARYSLYHFIRSTISVVSNCSSSPNMLIYSLYRYYLIYSQWSYLINIRYIITDLIRNIFLIGVKPKTTIIHTHKYFVCEIAMIPSCMKNTAIFCHQDPSVPLKEQWHHFHSPRLQKNRKKLLSFRISSLAQRAIISYKKLYLVWISQSWREIQIQNLFLQKNIFLGLSK